MRRTAAAAKTINSPHVIMKEYGDAPQRNKLEAPTLLRGVVAGARIATYRTNRTVSFTRPDFDFKEQARCLFNQTYRAILQKIWGDKHKTFLRLMLADIDREERVMLAEFPRYSKIDRFVLRMLLGVDHLEQESKRGEPIQKKKYSSEDL